MSPPDGLPRHQVARFRNCRCDRLSEERGHLVAESAQVISEEYGAAVSCAYPLEYRAVRAVSLLYAVLCDSFLRPRYGDREFQDKELKGHVLTTAYVSFTWAARMDSHVER